MADFLIQYNRSLKMPEFEGSTLVNCIDQINWLRNEKVHFYVYGDESNFEIFKNKGLTPIGTIPYVLKHAGKNIKPLNIPKDLEIFADREITYLNSKDPSFKTVAHHKFIKQTSVFKGFTGTYDVNFKWEIPEDMYMISDIENFISEYRVFVYQGDVLGIKHYSGDFFTFPDAYAIMGIVHTGYKEVWSFDVGITSTGSTKLIEAHDFFALGLYGFTHDKLPTMYAKAYKNMLLEGD